METTIMGYIGILGTILGLYWDSAPWVSLPWLGQLQLKLTTSGHDPG